MESWLEPGLSEHTQVLIRSGYGLLLLLFLIQNVFQASRFFVSDRWGGYAASTRLVDAIHNPAVAWFMQIVWFTCALSLITGVHAVPAALVNLLICRYYFVHMRWKGVLRGGGAPGFISYWMAACVFFLEYSLHVPATGELRDVVVLALKMDMAFIMLNAGLYKATAGYPRNDGVEYGAVNPWWGYWWPLYKKLRPDHWILKTLNHLAYLTEIAGAVLMFIPATQFWGGVIIFLAFVWIALNIRLGFLCEMILVSCLLYVSAGTAPDRMLQDVFSFVPATTPVTLSMPESVNSVLTGLAWAYLALLPLAHAGLFVNFFTRKTFPWIAQKALERYTNFFGIIIWRVFTTDIVSFFAHIYFEDPATGDRREYTEFRRPAWASRFRFWHVCEYVTLASVFTTLKYYTSNRALFEERIARYARTLPCPEGRRVVFAMYGVRKRPNDFEHVLASEFRVDPRAGTVEDRIIDPSFDLTKPMGSSPVHEGTKPGSYAPSKSE